MNKVIDFENKQNRDKTAKLVKKFKPVKNKGDKKAIKVTGKITQVMRPNQFVIKTKRGKYYPIVVDKGTVDVIFDYYDSTLIIVKDSFGDEHTLDLKYDVMVLLGEAKDFTYDGDTYKNVGYDLISFWGLEK